MRKLILMLLAAYKRWVSPQLPVACRFTPTCSDYAAEAVTRHGALGGTLLALWRLLRCNPLGGRGLDPVPEHFCCGYDAGTGQRLGGEYGPTDVPTAARVVAPRTH
jgi:putative membrane protein insertion efficiency factor